MKLQTNLLLAGILMTGQLLHGQTPTFLSTFEDQTIEPEIGYFGPFSFEYGVSGGYEIVANPSPDSYNSSNYVMKVFTEPGTGGRAEYLYIFKIKNIMKPSKHGNK